MMFRRLLTLYSAVWSAPDRSCEVRAQAVCNLLGWELKIVRFNEPTELPDEVRLALPQHHGTPVWWIEGRTRRIGVMKMGELQSWLLKESA